MPTHANPTAKIMSRSSAQCVLGFSAFDLHDSQSVQYSTERQSLKYLTQSYSQSMSIFLTSARFGFLSEYFYTVL